MDKNIKKLMADTTKLAEANGVTMIFSTERSIKLRDGTKVNGYFDDNDARRQLGVATGQPEEQWLPVFIHESCHMDQWLENSDVWTNSVVDSYNTEELIQLWMGGQIELNDAQLQSYISATRHVELDCEMRTVEKMKKYGIDINLEHYTQQANAYVWFYTMLKVTRRWYNVGEEPYNMETVWKQMPTWFMTNDWYDDVPEGIAASFLSLCEGKDVRK